MMIKHYLNFFFKLLTFVMRLSIRATSSFLSIMTRSLLQCAFFIDKWSLATLLIQICPSFISLGSGNRGDYCPPFSSRLLDLHHPAITCRTLTASLFCLDSCFILWCPALSCLLAPSCIPTRCGVNLSLSCCVEENRTLY